MPVSTHTKEHLFQFLEEMEFIKFKLIMGDDSYINFGYFTMFTEEKRQVMHKAINVKVKQSHMQLYMLTTAISRAYSDAFVEHMRKINGVDINNFEEVMEFFTKVPRSSNNIPFKLRDGNEKSMYNILSGKCSIDIENMPSGFGNFYKQSVIECSQCFNVNIKGEQQFGYFGSTTGKALKKFGLKANLESLEIVKSWLEEYYEQDMYLAQASDIICDYKRYIDIETGSKKYKKSMLRDSKQLFKYRRCNDE